MNKLEKDILDAYTKYDEECKKEKNKQIPKTVLWLRYGFGILFVIGLLISIVWTVVQLIRDWPIF